MNQVLVVEDAPVGGMLGNSPPMRELFRRIRKVAPTDSSVLISGESGTGKQLVARAIHQLSERQGREMVSMNCAAIPPDQVESELFGYERGHKREKGTLSSAARARPGLVESADGSTLFLDEIGELPLEAQARLLRVLEEDEVREIQEIRESGSAPSQKVDVRLVAATQRDLKELVAEGAFREDLYYRINVMALPIPPLRERGDDLNSLADALLERTCSRLKKAPRLFSPAALQAIAAHPWPGNVRELHNAIEQAVVLAEGDEIGPELLGIAGEGKQQNSEAVMTGASSETAVTAEAAERGEGDLSLQEYFQRFVRENEARMNETELAKALGISRKCLWERRQRFGMPRRARKQRSETQ